MARKPRIQFEGACYHVINRGNYRADIFVASKTIAAFEKCLFEACERSGWILHAYCLMRNHFHLAVETPRANLVEGMHWLQSTFAVRFNRYRRENGHLFQGRYKAILVEPGPDLAYVVNYLHLNPVKAGIVPVAQLKQYRWSSLRLFFGTKRPSFLQCDGWLAELGLSDNAAGWRSYGEYLEWLATDETEQKRQAFDKLCQGWAVGSEEFKKSIISEHREQLALQPWHNSDLQEMKQLIWSEHLARLLQSSGKSLEDARNDWKSSAWKVEIAVALRQKTTATNTWIATHLHMGKASSVSRWVNQALKVASKNPNVLA